MPVTFNTYKYLPIIMPIKLDVSYKVPDARGKVFQKKFESLVGSGNKVKDVALVNSYTIDKTLSAADSAKVCDALANPILEGAGQHPSKAAAVKFDWAIEIGYLPGVTDNIANTTRETIEDLLKTKFKPAENVYTSDIFYISGKLNREAVEKIAYSLYNPLIQSARIKTAVEFKKDKGMGVVVPKVNLKNKAVVTEVDLAVSDEELVRIGKQGIRDKDGTTRGPLALDIEYMKAIRDYFLKKKKRNPTDVELESIAQTWSEHCKHTIFADPIDDIKKGLYKTYIKEATNIIRKKKGKGDFCVSVFTDNAGAIEFDEKYLVTHKVETHNSPSALDPFGGSITGIVGVNRDAMGFGYGAKPVANVYGFCLADPKDTRPLYRDKGKKQKMLPPLRIMQGVIHGVNVGGNCSGIPTAQGFVYFDERYRGKPMVFVGTVGLIPRKVAGHSSTIKEAKAGDLIVMVGGRVGQDGIHGATFSSEGMDAGSPATAVQIGDPITQKKMSDALIKEARDLGLYTSITDNGAGGISCSVAEMAKECGGCEVQLDKVPLKYPGLEPWKTWISESQERMTLSVPKSKWKEFNDLMVRRGVEATVIGTFNSSGKCVVTYHDKKIMDVDLEFLHNGLPSRQLVTEMEMHTVVTAPVQQQKFVATHFKDMLKRLNICSYEFISNQYDHEVQANSVLKPLQGRGRVNADAAVIRPVLNSDKGVVLTAALNPSYSELDSYAMAASSIDGAIRTAVAAGGNINHLAILDNFCWCSSTEPVRLNQLKNAVKACYDYSIAYGTPLISGKDSMFNDFKGYDDKGNALKISIPPTLLVSAIGVMKDINNAVSLDFKFEGDLIYVLGDTKNELAGSEYFSMLAEVEAKKTGNNKAQYSNTSVPHVDAMKNKRLYAKFGSCTAKNLVSSAISVGRGGIAMALAKSAIAGKLGASVDLKTVSKQTSSDDFTLFSESQGRILVSIDAKNKKAFEKEMNGVSMSLVGKASAKPVISIKGRAGKEIVNMKVADALTAYKSTLKNY